MAIERRLAWGEGGRREEDKEEEEEKLRWLSFFHLVFSYQAHVSISSLIFRKQKDKSYELQILGIISMMNVM